MAIIKNTATINKGDNTFSSNEVEVMTSEALTLVKTASTVSPEVFAGSVISYTVVVTNPNAVAIDGFELIDVIDVLSVYVPGTLKIDGTALTPTATSPELKAPLVTIPASGTIAVTFDVSVL